MWANISASLALLCVKFGESKDGPDCVRTGWIVEGSASAQMKKLEFSCLASCSQKYVYRLLYI